MRRSYFFGPMPVEKWPPLDRAAWDRAFAGDPLEDGGAGPAAHWRSTSAEMCAIGYGVWLAWLEANGQLDEYREPDSRVTVDQVRRYLSDMRFSGLSESSCSHRLNSLGAALRVIAPSVSTTFITRAAGRLASRATRRRCLAQSGQNIDDLLTLGYKLVAQAPNEPSALGRALTFRDGLLLLLLVHRPLRVRNLTSIEIGNHLIRTRQGYRLEFPAGQMKSNRAYSCQFPNSLVGFLEEYTKCYRLQLVGHNPAVAALWPSIHGKPLAMEGVTAIVARRTLEEFGVAIRPHLFRHIVATAIAERLPAEADELITSLLGHHEIITSERHYNHAKGEQAASVLCAALKKRLGRSESLPLRGGPVARDIYDVRPFAWRSR